MALGAGDLIIVASPNADDFGVAGAVLVGGDWFVGAGILVEIASPFAKNAGVLWATFVGIEGFVGAGTAVVAASPHTINVGKAYLNKGAALYHINGKKVSSTLTAYWVDRNGVAQPLKNAHNKTAAAPKHHHRWIQKVRTLQVWSLNCSCYFFTPSPTPPTTTQPTYQHDRRQPPPPPASPPRRPRSTSSRAPTP